MAKTAKERKQEQRERDKQTEELRLARLLSRSIKVDLFKATDAKLIEIMQRLEIEEPQDVIQRLIHGAHRLDDESLKEITTL
ncbi:hypothetical protein [Pseudomonas sp. BN102]|uniref:hypothetical protein n=1 Tax=Pseudomonas sp. BN102 TaxID=2567886 RepID=UPI0024582AFA|nr:hypothetical protein [Pseudomonas sp. BN102]MDH4608118.1 hypothetical protein [Pseudomonas sp. BN102]